MKKVLFIIFFSLLLTLVVSVHSQSVFAATKYGCIWGGDHGGGTWDPAFDCPNGIGGTHYDISSVTINAGETASALTATGGSLTIYATNATITGTLSANAAGSAGGTSGGNGSGSGGGIGSATQYAGGGGYGGAGGTGTNGAGGGAYGSSINPTNLGSGGGASGGAAGGAGGGSITLIISGTLTINGTLNANGGNNNGLGSGGGSGGTINIQAGTIAGSGTMTANGGTGTTSGGNMSGGGGGGRIAVYYGTNSWSGNSLTAASATIAGTGGAIGSNGTVIATAANTPTIASLAQYQSDCATSVSAGGTVSSNTGCFKASLTDSDGSDTLSLQVEVEQSNISFTNQPTATGTGVAFSGSSVTGSVSLATITGFNYHWQARTIDVEGITSAWTAFGNTTDFAGSGFTCLLGGNLGGAAWDPATACSGGNISGIFTNVGALTISNGQTANVYSNVNGANYGLVSISATSMNIAGTLTANGAGFRGSTAINNDGSGYGGGITGTTGGGGGYGAIGAVGNHGGPGGDQYDSYLAPYSLGSGGGGAQSCIGFSGTGGAGAGGINLISTGTVTITGTVSANGSNAAGNNAGGGSGGAMLISAPTISGNGSITANGGNGGAANCSGGGGSGGRVALEYTIANTFSGTLTSNVGGGGVTQYNGTLIELNETTNDIILPASQEWNAKPYLEGASFTYHNMSVTGTWTLIGYYTTGTNGVGQVFNVNNFTLTTGSSITMNGFGYAGSPTISTPGVGPGGGGTGSTGGGGGYGGVGANGSSGGTGGSTNGSSTAPVSLGSGGGGAQNCTTFSGVGGSGAGAMEVSAAGTITINGSITANGSNGGNNAGGGSGGSIYLTGATFTGTGSMSANGGTGGAADCSGGGGGGGRIAIDYSVANTWSGGSLTAANDTKSGGGGSGAAVGTVVVQAEGSPSVISAVQYKPDCSTTLTSGATMIGSFGACLSVVANDSLNPVALTLQVEVQPNGTSFTNTANATATGTYTGTNLTINLLDTSLSFATSYHWQYRIVDAQGFATSWTQEGGNPDFVTPNSTPTRVGSDVTDTDTDFNTGSYASTSLIGTGSSATVELNRTYGPSNTTFYQPITINNTSNGNNLTNYDVSLTINTATLITAGKMRSDCGDIRFTDFNQTTILNYWIESGCNSASTLIWVQVPSIQASSSKTIYLNYGNLAATSTSSTASTFVLDQAGVQDAYRFDEATNTNTVDYSGNGNNGIPTGTSVVSGKFGNARSFNGTSDFIQGVGPVTGTGNWSAFAWIKRTATQSTRQNVISWGVNTTNNANYLFINASNKLELDLASVAGPQSAATITDTTSWHYVGVVNTGGSIQLYIDGSASGTPVAMSPNLSTGPLNIGRDITAADYFNGSIDEPRIYNTALSSTAVTADYNNYSYVTINDPGHELIRPYSLPEPTATAGAEVDPATTSGTWTSATGSSSLQLFQNSGWGDTTANSIAFTANLLGLGTNSTVQFQIRTASSVSALAGASYITLGSAIGGTFFELRNSDFSTLGVSALPYVQVIANFADSGPSPQLDNYTLYYTPANSSSHVTVDTDTDFNKGTYANTSVSGTGNPATVNLNYGSGNTLNYAYYEPVTINNTADASTLSNYQVSVQMNTAALITAGQMQSNCADIIFTDSNQTTLLGYWIESGCNTTTTQIWLKVPSIPASSSKTIYVYFGNPSATSASSGANTFDFFDNFSTFNTSAWSATDGETVSGNTIKITNGSVYSNSTTASQPNEMIEASVHWNSFSGGYFSGMEISTAKSITGNPGGPEIMYLMTNGGTSSINEWASSNGSSYNLANNTAGFTATAGTQYTLGEYVTPTNMSFYKNRTLLNSYSGTFSSPFYTFLGGYQGSSSGTNALSPLVVSWILERQAVTTPPAATFGSEISNTQSSGTWTSGTGSNALATPGATSWGDGVNSSSIAFYLSGTSINTNQTIQIQIRTASTTAGLTSASYTTIGTVTEGISLIITKGMLDGDGVSAFNFFQIVATISQSTTVSPVLDRMIVNYATAVPPSTPTSLQQFRNDGVTAISNGGWTSDGVSNNIVFSFSMASPNPVDTITPEVEIEPSGSSFTGIPNYSGSAVSYSGSAVTGIVDVTGLASCGSYKWQAFADNSIGLGSPTVFNATVPNFSATNILPTIGAVYDGATNGTEINQTTSINTVTANWTGFSDSCSGLTNSSYSVAIGTTSGGSDTLGYTSMGVTLNNPSPYDTFSKALLSLQTGVTYYVSVKATNTAGLSAIATSSGEFVVPTLSLTFDSNQVNIGPWNQADSYTTTATSLVDVLTNANNGYSLYASESGVLTNNAGVFTIPDFSAGTYANPVVWTSGLIGFGYTTSSTNINGFNPFANGTKYAAFSHLNPGDIVAQNLTKITGENYTGIPDAYTITYKTEVSPQQQSGTYINKVYYTVSSSF